MYVCCVHVSVHACVCVCRCVLVRVCVYWSTVLTSSLHLLWSLFVVHCSVLWSSCTMVCKALCLCLLNQCESTGITDVHHHNCSLLECRESQHPCKASSLLTELPPLLYQLLETEGSKEGRIKVQLHRLILFAFHFGDLIFLSVWPICPLNEH